MKLFLLAIPFFLSSCITIERHYPEYVEPDISSNEALQQHVNSIWGTTKLVPIRIRPIPDNVRNIARCEQGDYRYCRRD